MNRGRCHAPIFEEDDACLVFLELMAEAVGHFGLEMHAFALMLGIDWDQRRSEPYADAGNNATVPHCDVAVSRPLGALSGQR